MEKDAVKHLCLSGILTHSPHVRAITAHASLNLHVHCDQPAITLPNINTEQLV